MPFLAAPVFSAWLMEYLHNGILTTDIHYQVKLFALSVRTQAQRLHVTSLFTGIQQYNKTAKREREQERRENILDPLTLVYFQEVLLVYVVR